MRTRCGRCIILAFVFILAAIPAVAQTVIDTVLVGQDPIALAVNPVTNKIYVANSDDATASVIDGATDAVTSINIGQYPYAVAVNTVTNKAYVLNYDDYTMSVIDGLTNHTATIDAGSYPSALVVNPVTNKIFIANDNDQGTVTVIDGATNFLVHTVQVRQDPEAIALNPVTNKIYVANTGENTVSVIDGVTYSSTPVLVGHYPLQIAVNPVSNKIYAITSGGDGYTPTLSVIDGVTNHVTSVLLGGNATTMAINTVTNTIYVADDSYEVSVIDGVKLTVNTIPIDGYPKAMDVNPVTNKIYLVDDDNEMTMIDGITHAVTTVTVGYQAAAVAVNAVSNRIYSANSEDNTVSVVAGANSTPLQFVPVTPCRIADTRKATGEFGGPPITGQTSRDFIIPDNPTCGIPNTAVAYSLNVTAVPHGALGYLTVWPSGQAQPVVSTLNSLDGRIKANAAIVPAGAGEAVSVFATNTTDVVLDINGYFVPVNGTSLAFYPLTPCRVVDTRKPIDNKLGGPYLKGGVAREFPIALNTCSIPSTALAYSMNFTAVPHGGLSYLTVWPSDHDMPLVSTLNALTGTITANAAIVPAAYNGDISAFASNDTDLVIDVNGYFAPQQGSGLALYPLAPCRVLDTRKGQGFFSGKLNPAIDVVDSPCGVSTSAKAFVVNATVVPPGPLGYLTLWPDGQSMPVVSTLNAVDGAITSNMAIVPTNNGWIDAYASGLTNLVLDSFSYFAPAE